MGRTCGVLALMALAAVVLSSTVSAQGAGSGGVLEGAQDFYRLTTRSWLAPMSAIARRLFAALATLEIWVSSVFWFLRREALDEIAGRFLVKFILLSFMLLLITSAHVWLAPIVNALASAGRRAGIVAVPAGPSEIVDLGIQVAFSTLDTSSLPISLSSVMTLTLFAVSRFVVLGCFFAAAALLVLAWVESYIALGGGVLFLGFGGFRATAQFAENYLGYLVYLGVRLFALYLLLGLGMTVIATYVPPTLHVTTMPEMAHVVAIVVIFAVLLLRVPGHMASRIASGASFGLANALRNL